MDAKEFFEKNKGKYFDYEGHKVRVVGMSSTSSPILVSGYMYGWDISHKNSKLIDFTDNSLVKNNDKLWFASIDLLKQEEFNLCEILKGCEGITLYSPIHGDVVLESINNLNTDPIIVTLSDGDYIDYCKDGRYLAMYNGECMLFPSKENRDWSTFKKPIKIKEGTHVMCSNGDGWFLREYAGGKEVALDEGKLVGATVTVKYIVPATEFDFTDIESNKSKSII